MSRRGLAVGALLGVLSIACGRYGPPVRADREPTRASAPTTEAQRDPARVVEDTEGDEEGADREEVQP